MTLILFFFLLAFFPVIDGSCFIFHHEFSKDNANNCTLVDSHEENGRLCFRCYIYTHFDAIILNESCSPIPNNHCVDLNFNTTELFQTFSRKYAHLMNKLFASEDQRFSKKINSLHFHIKYDTHTLFSFETFRSFDQIENRTYHIISFELENRQNQLILPLDDTIQNMTLSNLQINIYCGLKGLYQYNYVSDHPQQSLLKSLRCEIPTTTVTTKLLPTTTTRSTPKKRFPSILFFSLIGGGSVIPCLLLICCLYLLCKQTDEKDALNMMRRESFTSSLAESV